MSAPFTVRLDQFEGPLDLLLFLIQNNEFDISQISISKITNQYLESIQILQELNFELAGEFLVMAATLLFWKSKAILPSDEADTTSGLDGDDELTPEDLVRQLMEHKRFLAAGDELAQIPRLGEDVFTRPNGKPPVERIWREMNLSDLSVSYQDAVVTGRKATPKILKKETVSLAEKILEMSQQLSVGKITPLQDLYAHNPIRPEKVVSFLASLELSRLKCMRLYQQETYDPIYLELLESLLGFDLNLAKGFDWPEQNPEVQPA